MPPSQVQSYLACLLMTAMCFAAAGCTDKSDKKGAGATTTSSSTINPAPATSPTAPQVSAPNVSAPSPTEPPAAPPIVISSRELYQELKADHAKADQKYRHKWLQTEGVIRSMKLVDIGFRQKGWFILLMADQAPGDKKDPELRTDWIPVNLTGTRLWEKIGLGGRVTVKGTLGGRGYHLENAEVVSFQGDPYRKITAQDLAKEFNTNPQAAAKKYGGKGVIVTGQWAAVYPHKLPVNERPEYNIWSVFGVLKGDGMTDIPVHFENSQEREMTDAKVGGEKTVIGTCELSKGRNPKYNVVGITEADNFDPQ